MLSSLTIIGSSIDLRTNSNIYYAQINIPDYLILVGNKFDRFDIQRPRQLYRPYERMKKDIMEGASLPAITLAINPMNVNDFKKQFAENNIEYLRIMLTKGEHIYILDGLQRTYIISDISKIKEFNFKKGQKLLLEFWIENEIKHLIYRLIVLNAGQKPMSMRHQVELLFMTMQDKIEKRIAGLKLIVERDEEKRTDAGQFPFDRIVGAFYSYITKSALVKRENIVIQELNELDVLSYEEDELNMFFEEFLYFLNIYYEMDRYIYKLYSDFQKIKVRSPKNWLIEDITMSSFFAAISQFGTDEKRITRIKDTLKGFVNKLGQANFEDDVLDLKTLSDIREGISPKKYNVGIESRKIITNGFKEYFREEGELSFKECWKLGSN